VIRLLSAPWVLPGLGGPAGPLAAAAIPDGAVALDGDVVVEVGPAAELEARHGPAERLDAVLLPALVNAHLHLELSHLAGAVPGGEGLAPWIERFVRTRLATGEAARLAGPAMAQAAQDLVRFGVAAVGDVSNTLASHGALAAAGLCGTVFHEVFGTVPARLAEAREEGRRHRDAVRPCPGLRVVESPHAVYSTDEAGLLELLRGPPASIHLAEDPAERRLLAAGDGPFNTLRLRMGGSPAPAGRARSAVALVAPHLGPGWLAVHCVDLDEEDLAALRRCGATVVLCPRSNAHISRARPPLPALLAAGVPLAIGTDSLASSPSLSPLAELAALRRAFSQVPARALLPLAWNGAAVGAPHVGRLASGLAPGLLAAPLPAPSAGPRAGARVDDPFEFLATGEGPAGRAVEWLARPRPEVRAP
jgi:cytosine/adenosine deaminase-related metal-dependent hydrolase